MAGFQLQVITMFIFQSVLAHGVLSVLVNTTVGPIVGQQATDGNYSTFFGVPYARVNEERPFENTLEWPKFTSPFIASDPSIICPQVILREGGILQCLRLNIYVPSNIAQKDLPVFVWFHGGGLAFGSAGEYNATHLVQEEIIVVTANYRLGPYGFLCTSDIKNQGLQDMKTALKWIKNNIETFGGNPRKVTIAGESWGGSAVDYLLYEEADFNQAIIQSGTRYSYAVSSRKDTKIIKDLASRLGHNTTCCMEALKFLNRAEPIAVMRAYNEFDYVFGICEERGDFEVNLTANYAKKVSEIPIMIGYTSKETFEDIASQPDSYYETVQADFENSLGKVFDLSNSTIKSLANTILDYYKIKTPVSKESMLDIIDLSSDFQENFPTERSVNNYLRLGNKKVYKYMYSYIGESKFKNVTGVGAYHTQELPLLFDWWTKLKTDEEFKMRRWLVKMWTNFVKYRNPTPNHGNDGWLPTDAVSRRYLDIDVNSMMKTHAYKDRMTYWENLWSKYRKDRK